MTENKIKPTIEQVIYCLKAESERYSEVCEECSLYEEVGCDHCFDDTTDVAITLLEKYLQYRAIGTVEEIRELKEKNEPKKPITYKGTNGADCPCCGARVRGIKEPWGNWCSKCGQKLDWE